jgi:hypothetical protein
MGRVRVVYFHIRNSEGGSPHLCRLRTASVEPCGTSIDYVLAHTEFIGSHKLSSFDGCWVGRHSTILHSGIGIVWGPPTDAHWGIAWKTCTRVWWARLDSLIVIMNCGLSWCLHGSRVSCYQVIFHVKGILILISMTPSDMGESCSLCSNIEVQTPVCSYENYVNDMTTW